MGEIAQGYTEPCDVAGGVEIVYGFAVKQCDGTSNIATYEVTNGEVTALTLISGKQAYAFEVEVETANFQTESVGEKANGAAAYSHTSTIVLHRNLSSDIVNNDAMVKGRHAFIHKLNDGTYELVHMTNGAKCQVTRASGTSYEDMNGSTITATSREKTPAYKISSTIVDALLTPAS